MIWYFLFLIRNLLNFFKNFKICSWLQNKSNLVTPRNGELMIGAIQDFITGGYLLTQKDMFFNRTQAYQLAGCLVSGLDADMNVDIPSPAIIKPNVLWTGKQIFSLILKPNKNCPIKANLRTKGRNYTRNEELCTNDSCKSLFIVFT